ncbi:protein ORF74 [Cyprinid herpesvirus 1]|uniref:Protein ORF74 n=1 Tax=Cyprinid herpesvirus 1 TaxID=317858 RepID=K7PBL5_9VIRU|nr:protein ORF74 [Cyprinid herpesvirus 1]AFJ20371.1 protein ORF74 [Cyprinid herpesvirus 1]
MDTQPSIFEDFEDWPGVPFNSGWLDQTAGRLRDKINQLEEDLRGALDSVDSSRAGLTTLLLRHDPQFRVFEKEVVEQGSEPSEDFTASTYTLEDEIDRVRALYFGECEWRCKYSDPQRGELLGCFPTTSTSTSTTITPPTFEEKAKRLSGPERSVRCVKSLDVLKQRCLTSLTLNSRFITSHSL